MIENSTHPSNAWQMKIVPSEPVLTITIAPKTPADASRLERGVVALASSDPSLRSVFDPATGQTTLKGCDELHLDTLVTSLLDDFKVKAKIGPPSIVYRKSGKQLLEPIMRVEVATPNESLELVESDIRSRRGKVLEKNEGDASGQISALVPMANMFGYWNSILSMTSGRATFSTSFDHYAPIPNDGGPDDQPPFAQGIRA